MLQRPSSQDPQSLCNWGGCPLHEWKWRPEHPHSLRGIIRTADLSPTALAMSPVSRPCLRLPGVGIGVGEVCGERRRRMAPPGCA